MVTNLYVEKARQFLALHHSNDVLILPNAWDVLSARVYENAGFPAVGTSSAAIAWAHGCADGEHIQREIMLQTVTNIIQRVHVPVTADLEAGYGHDPATVEQSVREAIDVGAVGANIEDSVKADPRDTGKQLFDLELAVERIRAAREVANAYGVPFMINARTDAILKLGKDAAGRSEAIKRGNAYLEAGASGVFVVGVSDKETIGILTREINGPLNVLAYPGVPSVPELKQLGVKRLSFGAGLARVAYSVALETVQLTRDSGNIDLSRATLSNQDLNHLF